MASKYSGMQGGFATSLREFAEQTKEKAEQAFRTIVIEIGNSVIMMSPVGNPEIWAQNAVATQYNAAVAEHNASLRNDPDNLTSSGRLKRGRKLNDGMDVVAPHGYVGGRFRGNWQFSVDSPASGTVERIDPSGADTINELESRVASLTLGQTAFIVNNLPYAVPLEYGHSKQAPEGMVRITLARFSAIVDEAVRSAQ